MRRKRFKAFRNIFVEGFEEDYYGRKKLIVYNSSWSLIGIFLTVATMYVFMLLSFTGIAEFLTTFLLVVSIVLLVGLMTMFSRRLLALRKKVSPEMSLTKFHVIKLIFIVSTAPVCLIVAGVIVVLYCQSFVKLFAVLFFAGLLFFNLLKQLTPRGFKFYLEAAKVALVFICIAVPLCLVLMAALVVFGQPLEGLFFIPFIALNYWFIRLLKRPTPEGVRVREEIAGFKMYLETAEKESLERHLLENLDKKDIPRTIAYYLPYAIALGFKVKWADRFCTDLEMAALRPGDGSRSKLLLPGLDPAYNHFQSAYDDGAEFSEATAGLSDDFLVAICQPRNYFSQRK